MTETILDRLKKVKGSDSLDEQDDTVDLGLVGWLRGTRDRALFLECHFKTGNSIAFSYALLEEVSFNPSEGITLIFMGRKVSIKGTHLELPIHGAATLKDGFLRQRVAWIRESGQHQVVFGEGNHPQISEITV